MCASFGVLEPPLDANHQTALFLHVGAIKSALHHWLTMQSKHLAVQLQFVSSSYESACTQPAYQWVMCARRWEFPAHQSRVKCAGKKKKKNHHSSEIRCNAVATANNFCLRFSNYNLRYSKVTGFQTDLSHRWITKLNVWRLASSGGRLWAFWAATSSLD